MAFHTSASLLTTKASTTPHVITALFTLPLKGTGENTSTVFAECHFRQERSQTEEFKASISIRRWHESSMMRVITSFPDNHDLIHRDVTAFAICIAKMQHTRIYLDDISPQAR